eukprot:g2649.t1
MDKAKISGFDLSNANSTTRNTNAEVRKLQLIRMRERRMPYVSAYNALRTTVRLRPRPAIRNVQKWHDQRRNGKRVDSINAELEALKDRVRSGNLLFKEYVKLKKALLQRKKTGKGILGEISSSSPQKRKYTTLLPFNTPSSNSLISKKRRKLPGRVRASILRAMKSSGNDELTGQRKEPTMRSSSFVSPTPSFSTNRVVKKDSIQKMESVIVRPTLRKATPPPFLSYADFYKERIEREVEKATTTMKKKKRKRIEEKTEIVPGNKRVKCSTGVMQWVGKIWEYFLPPPTE